MHPQSKTFATAALSCNEVPGIKGHLIHIRSYADLQIAGTLINAATTGTQWIWVGLQKLNASLAANTSGIWYYSMPSGPDTMASYLPWAPGSSSSNTNSQNVYLYWPGNGVGTYFDTNSGYQFGFICEYVDSLAPTLTENLARVFRWDLIVLYEVLHFVENSVFNPTHQVLWLTIEQFISREAQVKLYDHLLSLSLRFHIGRKTGEVLRAMDRGTSSISNVLNYLLFEILPTFADIIIGAIFLMTTFDIRFTLVAIVTIIVYTVVIVLFGRWRAKLRKRMNKADDSFRSIGVDSLLNYETVKYYNAEEYETDRYRAALIKSQDTDWMYEASYWIFSAVEKLIVRGGLLAGSLLCAYLISREEDGLTVGDYVLFGSFMVQLTTPLDYLQYMIRYIQKAAIDMDKMFDIMEEQPKVRDQADAIDFKCTAGKIEFRNVSFSFKSDQPVLNNLNFIVEPGRTLAIESY